MSPALSLLANHLWQSTLLAVAAGLLTVAFRNNRAHVRYWLWLTASIKFLVPFAALTALGAQIAAWVPLRIVEHADTTFIITTLNPRGVAGPGVPPLLLRSAQPGAAFPILPSSVWFALNVLWGCGAAAVAVMWCIRLRRVAATVRAAARVEHGRELDALRRLERAGDLGMCTEMVSSHAPIEPGVFGILKPVLLWPQDIAEYLSDNQIDAILAHELSHIRRRDNLTAAVHMAVQTVFWFHPLVWWIGARLVEERERACDEEVVRLGNAPHVYAESILKTCQFYMESPLVCVAGVTGADLKRRIEHIMRSKPASVLSGWKKLLLAAAGIAAVTAPVVVGAVNAPPRVTSAPHVFETRRMIVRVRSAAQLPSVDGRPAAFDVASIKPNRSGDLGSRVNFQPGRFTATNLTLRQLVMVAYGTPLPLPGFRTLGGPDWIDSERFDVVAQSDSQLSGTGPSPETSPMMQTLLAERFHLMAHRETRELPIYALVTRQPGKLGALLVSETACTAAGPFCGTRGGTGRLTLNAVTMPEFATALSRILNRVVVDRTGVAGAFDGSLEWTPDQAPPSGVTPAATASTDGPSIFTAVQEQLGLKLESTKAPVDVLVIDRAEHPTEN